MRNLRQLLGANHRTRQLLKQARKLERQSIYELSASTGVPVTYDDLDEPQIDTDLVEERLRRME